MSDETLDLIAAVGGSVTGETITLTAAQLDAFTQLLIQPWRAFIDDLQVDIATALGIAKQHIAEVNLELAQARCDLALARAAAATCEGGQ
jgi:hypothetical protein